MFNRIFRYLAIFTAATVVAPRAHAQPTVVTNGPAASFPADSPVADALARAEASVQRILDVPAGRRTCDNTIGALDDILAEAWSHA